MFGGSCSLKGGYRIANKRHYLKSKSKSKRKSLKKRTRSLKSRTGSLKKRTKSLRGGGKHKHPENNH
jgi:hypothetical protein